MKDRKGPIDDVVAHLQEDIDPFIGRFNAGIHRIEIEQAYAEARGKTYKRYSGKQVKRIYSRIVWHNAL